MAKITYDDKVGIVPKTVHINQWWDDDANEVKEVVNSLDDRVISLETGAPINSINVGAIYVSGLTFDVFANSYPIVDTFYSATRANVTLDTADATNDRIDLIGAYKPVAPATLGIVGKITGTPEANPSPPDYDAADFYPIKFVLVKATATVPSDPNTGNDVVNEIVYADGTGEPDEWTFSSNNASIVNSGGVINATNPSSSHKATMTNNAVVTGLNHLKNFSLSFDITLKEAIGNSYIFVKLFGSGGSAITNSLLFRNGDYGFNSSSLLSQTITIDGSEFSFTTLTDIYAIQIYPFKNSYAGYTLDNIKFTIGVANQNPQPTIGVESVTGDLVDNTDPKNPVIDTPSTLTLDASGFNNNLAPTDNTLQKIADKFDAFAPDISSNFQSELLEFTFGAIIEKSLNPLTEYVGTPSIFKTSSGRYLLKRDYFGDGTNFDTTVLYYTDDLSQGFTKGKTLSGIYWATLFEYNSVIYLLGVTEKYGDIAISQSLNDGLTWSTPTTVIPNIVGYNGWHTSAIDIAIKDGYLIKAFEITQPETFASGHKLTLVFADLTDLMDSANWSYSNIVSFDGTAFENSGIYSNTTEVNKPKGDSVTKGFLESNLIELSNSDLRIVSRLEQTPSSNYAVYFDVNWNSVTPTASTINTTHNFIEMPGGNLKFQIIWDSISSKHWAVTNVNKYKYFDNNRIETYLLSSDDDCLTWDVHEKVSGYTPTINWENEIPQLATQYPHFIIDGNDILIALRSSDYGANTAHNANILSLKRFENFKTSPIATIKDGSLIIDENSTRLEDSNGVSIIHDQSKYYNSPYMETADNDSKPNWVTDGIQFNGAEYLRVMYDKKLNLTEGTGFSFFVVIENIQNSSGKRIFSRTGGVDDSAPGSYFSTINVGLSIETCRGQYSDYSDGNNYIIASSYNNANGDIYNYLNGVNRGTPDSVSGGLFVTDHIEMTSPISNDAFKELWIGNREAPSSLFFEGKIKALHIFPNYMTPTEMVNYMTSLNTIYSIY